MAVDVCSLPSESLSPIQSHEGCAKSGDSIQARVSAISEGLKSLTKDLSQPEARKILSSHSWVLNWSLLPLLRVESAVKKGLESMEKVIEGEKDLKSPRFYSVDSEELKQAKQLMEKYSGLIHNLRALHQAKDRHPHVYSMTMEKVKRAADQVLSSL